MAARRLARTARGWPRMTDVNIDPQLLSIIVCPACHGALAAGSSPEGGEELVCRGCGNAYPVRDDIPVLLVDEARKPA